MKIFISWSGERSQKVASLLDSWLSCVIQAVEPWLSTTGIDRGSLWFTEITAQLSQTNNGIICLTKANMTKPWILFEAGALAKGLESNRLFTFLVDVEPQEIKDPLGQFNHTVFEKESVRKLVKSINRGLGEKMIKDKILDRIFDTYWPQFESEFQNIIQNTMEEEVKMNVDPNELLVEIHRSVRGMERRLRKVESDYELNKNPNASNLLPNDLASVRISVRNLMEQGLGDQDIASLLSTMFAPELVEEVLGRERRSWLNKN